MPADSPYTKRQQRYVRVLLRLANRFNTALIRWSGGRIGGSTPSGVTLCLLTTTGRKSGQERTVALFYLQDGSDVVLVASQAGMPTVPASYLNLSANPSVSIRIGKETRRYHARTATDEEHAQRWPRLVAAFPRFDDYQARTERVIPVVICTPS